MSVGALRAFPPKVWNAEEKEGIRTNLVEPLGGQVEGREISRLRCMGCGTFQARILWAGHRE